MKFLKEILHFHYNNNILFLPFTLALVIIFTVNLICLIYEQE